jgi:hypothetical protein
VFLASNAHYTYIEMVLSETLGKDWEYFFDLVLCSCQKPLFYTANTPFYQYNPQTSNGEKIESVDAMIPNVKKNKILLNGNARLLTQYL